MIRGVFLAGLLLAPACTDLSPKDHTGETGETGDACGEPVEHPHDTSKPSWTYDGDTDGQDHWGELSGYETCSTGLEQSPIDIVDTATEAGSEALEFSNYDVDLPLDLLNNGHTLQVNVETEMGSSDPQISFGGQTWYLIQFHAHATSEHTLDGSSSAMELHFVHQSSAGDLAVVGLMLDDGAENEAISAMLTHDPGDEMEVECEDTLNPADLLPTDSGFYHYDGSLTTPDCSEGVSWFVLTEHGEVSADQSSAWEALFDGTTNREVQPLAGRVVTKYDP